MKKIIKMIKSQLLHTHSQIIKSTRIDVIVFAIVSIFSIALLYDSLDGLSDYCVGIAAVSELISLLINLLRAVQRTAHRQTHRPMWVLSRHSSEAHTHGRRTKDEQNSLTCDGSKKRARLMSCCCDVWR